ncbi:MAG: 30S ribosomal protein S6 [FCB group bacterium]|nr:30S ribosomal protein S6 [FCB group bacterium]
MRTYEALYIIRPDKSEDEVQTIDKQVQSLVTNNGGTIVRSEIWGKRRLAYEVNHFTEGHYILMRFESQAAFVARLEGFFRLDESVIRSLVVYFDEKTLRAEEEQKVRTEELIRASATRRAQDDDDDDDEPMGRRRDRDRDRDRDDDDF